MGPRWTRSRSVHTTICWAGEEGQKDKGESDRRERWKNDAGRGTAEERRERGKNGAARGVNERGLMREVVGPAKEETDSGGQETRAETTIEPGEKVGRDAGYVLKTYAKGNHECDDKVSLKAESPENAGLFLLHGKNAFGVFSDHSGKHHVESNENQDGQGNHPNQGPGFDYLKIVTQSGNGYLCPDGRPKETVDC